MTADASPEISFAVHPAPDPVPSARRAELLEAPGFGRVFTDHMITLRWTAERGWHDGRLEPYGPLRLDPATSVFHYAQEIFEGLKAYRQHERAMWRSGRSPTRPGSAARRSGWPCPSCPRTRSSGPSSCWSARTGPGCPPRDGHSLYLRPFMIATDPSLGVSKPSSSYLVVVIASPAGPYFGGGVRPVSVWLAEDYTRAAPGGTGAAKAGGNYAAGFAAQRQALEHGCDQVVWLDAVEHRWVEEMGGMNMFFVHGSGSRARITTPPLTGTLLPGITRDALLTLAPDLGIPAAEEPISVAEWRDGCRDGEITEVFACGTAAVVTPVGTIRGSSGGWTVGPGGAAATGPGPVTRRLRKTLMGLQFGQLPDPYGWIHKIC